MVMKSPAPAGFFVSISLTEVYLFACKIYG